MTRARALEPALQTSQVVVELCSRLDNLPLALELAAARTSSSPRSSFSSGFPNGSTCSGGPRRRPTPADSPSDHRVVVRPPRRHRAETLSSALGLRGRLFVRICRGGRIGRSRHTSVAARQEPASPQGEPARPALLDARDDPRARSREAGGGGGDRRAIRRLHAEHYLTLARSANLDAEAEGQQRHDLVIPERDNLRAALAWALETGESELGLELVLALENFWATTAPQEGVDWVVALLDGASALPDRCSCGLCASRVAWRTCSVRSTSP